MIKIVVVVVVVVVVKITRRKLVVMLVGMVMEESIDVCAFTSFKPMVSPIKKRTHKIVSDT